MSDSERLILCPDSVAVIGGGRWARVLIEVLSSLVPPSVELSVHSPHNAESMSVWAKRGELNKRIHVSSEWPPFLSIRSHAVIVANAARDHEKAVERALLADSPVLVEKPMTLTAAASQRLVDLARHRNGRFAAAHVFLFAGYLDHFSKLVADAGNIQSLKVCWTDPQFENRYGEPKQYDPTLPIFADWLPHILSMLGALTPNHPVKCGIVESSRDGMEVELSLMLGDIPCRIRLARNSDQRRRIIEADTGQKKLQLDFSKEPGIITDDSTTMVGDPDWEITPRPVAQMLTAFLKWAAGGETDSRLNVEIGLRACQLIDQVAALL